MNKLLIDMTGASVGALKVLGIGEPDKNGKARWKCLCACGNITNVRGPHLRNGNTKSCGCLSNVARPDMFTVNGYYGTRIHGIWQSMKQRCFNKNSPAYVNYGGRGITMCDSWKDSFLTFLHDMGERPSLNHSIERINNDGPYSPENCKWATPKEQARNKRSNRNLTLNGTTMTVAQWSETLGLSRRVINDRLRKGWSTEKVLSITHLQLRSS